ncbi:purine and uridine phosphorylase [Colletotrichum caudatum]|nr:purine and uridine phosphorylase [Colletotrichum caudatum]
MQDGPRTYERYTVAVVHAIEFETSAVRYMLDREHPSLPTKEGDSNIYVLGELSGHDVVLACLPGSQGKGAAATVATNMARTFPSIQWRFFVGIGGGVPSNRHDIRLGDVVVSMPKGPYGGVVQYDLGKETDDGFVLEGSLTLPPHLLRSAVAPSSNLDVLFEAGYAHRPGNATCEECDEQKCVYRARRDFEGPEIHYGLIASGDRVVKSATKRGEILRTVGDVLCFEMEAAGLMTEFSCIVIRGISDYADSHKNDDWHRYAAATAAACTKELLTYVDPMVVPAVSAASAPSIDAAANRDKPVAAFHGTGIQHSGSGNFSARNDLHIGGRPGAS